MRRLNLFVKLAAAVLSAGCLAVPAFADPPEIVITANRLETPKEKVGSSVTVVTADEIADRQEHSVLEVLKAVPGVDVVQSGPAGGNTAVFLRGANSEHTLVLVDGVEVNNPINPVRSFDFANLTVDNIERIEVLRGPQTTLYGSDAMGGVIQIFTKKGTAEPHFQLSTEIGSYDTYRESAAAQGSAGIVSGSAGFAREDRQGMSNVRAASGDSENDKYENTSTSMRLAVEPVKEFSLELTGRWTIAHAEIDDGPGSGGDDPNRYFDTNQYSERVAATVDPFDGLFRQTAGMSFAGTNYSDDTDPDLTHPLDRLRSNYKGSQLKFDTQSTFAPTDILTFVAGLETEEEKGNSTYSSESEFGPFSSDFPEAEVRTNGIYGELGLEPVEDLSLTIGGRVDDHSRFGTRENYRLSASYLVAATETRLRSSLGTAYKAPSLYQLFSEFGRPDLQPERSLGFDGGVEQEVWGKDVTTGVTYFQNRFNDLISFDPNTFIFENILEAKTQGFEGFLNFKLPRRSDLRIDYTYLDTRDESTGLRLLRRAKHHVSVNLGMHPVPDLTTHVNVLIEGSRADNDFTAFPAGRVQLTPYTVVNLAAEYRLSPLLSLFAHANNIFDKDYQEILGYNTPGATVTGGVKLGM